MGACKWQWICTNIRCLFNASNCFFVSTFPSWCSMINYIATSVEELLSVFLESGACMWAVHMIIRARACTPLKSSSLASHLAFVDILYAELCRAKYSRAEGILWHCVHALMFLVGLAEAEQRKRSCVSCLGKFKRKLRVQLLCARQTYHLSNTTAVSIFD